MSKGKYLDVFQSKVAKNIQRREYIDNLMLQATVGKQLMYYEQMEGRKRARVIAGTIFYTDKQKIGLINKKGRKEWVTMNDLMPAKIHVIIKEAAG